MDMTLGTWLKVQRVLHKETQKQLGKTLGVSDSTIGYWEKDKQAIPSNYLKAILEHYKADANTVLGLSVDKMLPLDGLSDKEVGLLTVIRNYLLEQSKQ